MPDALDRMKAALADRYAIERELGAGGMATVYLAEDVKHQRKVAVKVLRPELTAALGHERFLREITTTANLRHPHILPLYDSGEAGGFLFYVMPYVEGESLGDRINREKQLPLDDAVRIAREVADALSYAHGRGVIHRDIKPENIMLESGHAVVADFGIARAVSAAGGDKLTQTGLAIGTPAYMSPEQAGGEEDLDGRSDLYALGCVLYEMLAGQPPFTGPTVESLVRQHLGAPPPPVTQLRPAVPAEIAGVLERALAKNPADRFNPVALFADALGPRGAAPVSSARAAAGQRPRSWARRALLAALVVAVIASAVALGRWIRPGATGSRHLRTAIAVLPFQNLSAEEQHAYFAGGLHDELLTQLAKVATLTVMGRTSVMAYAGTTKPVQEIAGELGVGSIVEGSVQVLGDRLRVNVQLLDAETGAQVWAESYNRTLDDAFAIQSHVAQQVVAAVGAALAGDEAGALAAAPTQNGEAYRLYLQGEEYRRRPGNERQNFEIAEQLYEQAVSLDSTFAIAYTALADVHGQLYWLYGLRPARLESERAAAEAARRLAPDLPQTRWAMGMVYYHEQDFRRALKELTAAAEGLPGSAELWTYVGYAHRRLGQWDQALASFERATTLDPRDAGLMANIGETFLYLHRYRDAIGALNRALELAPDQWAAHLTRARTYLLWQGELDSLRQTLAGGEDFAFWGSNTLWSARLALWERRPDRVLALLGPTPAAVTFEAQMAYEPALLYAGWAHQLRRDLAAASAAFTEALAPLELVLRERPNDWRFHASRGLAMAGLGRRAEAIDEARSIEGSIVYADPLSHLILAEARAMIFAQAGLADEAVAELEPLLAGPSWTSVHLLRLDPRWDPVRDDPRFQALLVKYANPEPVR